MIHSPETGIAALRLNQVDLRGQGDLTVASSQGDVSRIYELASQFITDAQPHLAGTVSVHVEVFQQMAPFRISCQTLSFRISMLLQLRLPTSLNLYAS